MAEYKHADLARETSLWLTVSNVLCVGRLLAGVAFPWLPVSWRLPVVIAAAVSDVLDGFLGRATHTTTHLGRVLDPIADKVFVLGACLTLILDGSLAWGELILLGLRDLAVILRGSWVLVRGRWSEASGSRPTVLGKLTTVLQFLALAALLLWGELPVALFLATVMLSGLAGVQYLLRARN
jgi:phosphatidylglycerophosphate synthase